MSQASTGQKRVLVTGASGFIGRDLVVRLAKSGWLVRAAARQAASLPAAEGVEPVEVGDLSGPMEWARVLEGVTHVVHLAGIAHATSAIPASTYDAVNAQAVGRLAAAARQAGVRRVVMMSSIRAQCGPSAEGIVTETQEPAPIDAYGRSKLAGEKLLAGELEGSNTAWCVLRPVVVYGPGVKGNMARLLRLARTPWPLPLGGLRSRRSLLGLANLALAVEHGLTSAAAQGGTFILCDPGPMTFGEIVAAMRCGMQRPPRVVTLPISPLRTLAHLAGRGEAWQRIAGDLVVSTAALERSGWTARETAREGLLRWMREG